MAAAATDRQTGIRLFSVQGIQIRLDYSWFIVFALALWSLSAGYFVGQALGHAGRSHGGHGNPGRAAALVGDQTNTGWAHNPDAKKHDLLNDSYTSVLENDVEGVNDAGHVAKYGKQDVKPEVPGRAYFKEYAYGR